MNIETFDIVWSLILFALGASLTSFYIAQIYRIENGLKFPEFVRESSFCEGCKKKLRTYELVPIVSYIFQRGHCSKCGFRISPSYPIFEATLGASFVILFSFGVTWEYYLLLNLLFFLAVYDYYYKGFPQLIMHVFLLMTGAIFLYNFFFTFDREFITVIVSLSIILSVAILNLLKKSFGTGDLLVLLMISFIVTLTQFVGIVFISIVIAGLISIILLASKKLTKEDAIPFVPFLFIGYVLVFPLEPLVQQAFAYMLRLW